MTYLKSYIHGNAFVAQNVGGSSVTSPGPLTTTSGGVPWSDVVGLPQGWGKTYRGKRNESVWFHVAVPTPSIVEGPTDNLRLDKVFIFFHARPGCSVTQIHFWDGKTPIHKVNVSITGDNSGDGRLNVNEFFIPQEPRRPMKEGLGISVLVRFTNEADITFFSANAGFFT